MSPIPSRAELIAGVDGKIEARPHGELIVDDDNERECIWLHLTITQAECLLSGYVPSGTKGTLHDLLNYKLEDERRAARPVRTRKGKA